MIIKFMNSFIIKLIIIVNAIIIINVYESLIYFDLFKINIVRVI